MAAVLITGATGKQGGSLVRNLVSRQAPFEILAVTRNAQSSSARKLTELSSKIKIVEGNLDDPAGIFANASKVTQQSIWGVFSVQAAGTGSLEEEQGKALVDASLRENVKFFVYSSVDRGGDASFQNPTNIPHFIHKHNIEHHLVEKTKNTEMKWLILRPTAFFDNLTPDFLGKVFATSFKLALKGKPLQLVATSDIGYFAAEGFLNPEQYQGKGISLAGDELTYDQYADIFLEKTGTKIPTTFELVSHGIMAAMKDLGYMFQWFHDEGYKANITELKETNPGLKDFATWLETESEFTEL
ncbi:nucleoside-diphosphate-sugar epimerase family protein [Penicillium taxi]|uniref:nucleoside-diphosphate-sugar epimerase family protein n=1 Tax=Penicillium taxi TaxID=168475 RepID=UPI002545081A|nr:nucleoside-diphosphate-sugar epimerase family protein [Penicillium taxi]KAJ5899503.1 nucleoside-diphosphate-sugar epimerase family protein [Penicillium taxi]